MNPEHHDQRAEMLRNLGVEHDLDVFVETGTALGAMLRKLADDFERLVSIELSLAYHESAIANLEEFANIELHLGDSERLLPGIIDELTEPALVFLDGHYSGPGTGRGKADTPVRAELDVVCSHDLAHVVVVDDARLFGVDPEYPSKDWVFWRAEQWSYDVVEDLDAFVLTPLS